MQINNRKYFISILCFLVLTGCTKTQSVDKNQVEEIPITKVSTNTSNFDFTNFGNQYLDQIPTDATIKKYDEKRFCMIAGQILSEDKKPIAGVKISIYKHPEYGTTLTDAKGNYSIPSEGGVQLTMRYTKKGYTTIDRNIDAPVQDWIRTPNVVMLKQDTKVTEIKFDKNSIQLHSSTPIKDERGERSATLVFDKGTKVTVTSKDGSSRNLTNIKVTATEFIIPQSMPSDLPASSAYTYCADYKVDGVNDDENITFNKPIVTYVDNFLGFDVGEAVPMGYYDREKSKWVAANNGVVIKLLDTDGDNKIDALDSTGDDKPNDLNKDGSFSDEISGISNDLKYVAGNTYWRSEITHFTPWDYNWPYALPPGSPPPAPGPGGGGPGGGGPPPPPPKPEPEPEPDRECSAEINSYITTKTRVFHEDIPIAGTNLTLNYSSRRTKGYKYIIHTTVPAAPENAELLVKLEIAGKNIEKVPSEDQSKKSVQFIDFLWDGKDVNNDNIFGVVKARLSIGYSYPSTYYKSSSDFDTAWAQAGEEPIETNASNTTSASSKSYIDARKTRDNIILWKDEIIVLSVEPREGKHSFIANGWTLSGHNQAYNNLIVNGDGTYVGANPLIENGVLTVIAGKGGEQATVMGTMAINTKLFKPIKMLTDASGNIFFIDDNKILEIDSDKKITIIAGGITKGFSGDGGLAINAEINNPTDLDIDDEGNIFFTDHNNQRIRKINKEGIITTVVGGGQEYRLQAKPHKAKDVKIHYPKSVKTDDNGNMFFIDGEYIFKVDSNGFMTTIAGTSGYVGSPTNRPALGFLLRNPYELEVDNKGNIYVLSNRTLLKIRPDGIIVKVEGKNARGSSLKLDRPRDLSIDKEGSIFVADSNNLVIKIDKNNFFTTIVGGGKRGVKSNYATKKHLSNLLSSTIDAQGNLFFSTIESGSGVIYMVTPPPFISRYKLDNSKIIYKNNNNTADIYSATGKHIKTIDLLTKKILKKFSYSESGRLSSIEDQFNKIITIEYDDNKKPISITSPNGHKTYLTVNNKNDLLKVEYENRSNYHFEYGNESLMLKEIDPNENIFLHEFDLNGRLSKSIDSINGKWTFSENIIDNYTTVYTQKKPEGNIRIVKDTLADDSSITSETILTTGDVITTKISTDKKIVTVESDSILTTYNYEFDSKSQRRVLSSKIIKQPNSFSKDISYKTSYRESTAGTTSKTKVVTINGKSKNITTDYQNANIKITTSEKRVLETKYDKNTRLTSSITAGTLIPVNFSYDDKGRLTTISQGDRKTFYTYDTKGNISTIKDPRGKLTKLKYDVMDRLKSTIYPDGVETSFTYDHNGNMIKLVTPTPSDFVFEVDALDQPIKTTSPSDKSTLYAYNKNRRLTKVTKPSGAMIENIYTNDRLSSTKTPEGTTKYNYLFANKVKSISKDDESISYTYNGALPTNVIQKGVLNQVISYDYNNDFNITRSTYAGKDTGYNYDNDNLIIKRGDFQLTRHTENAYITNITDGRLIQEREYNDYGELSKLSDNIFSYALTQRDKSGAITQKVETINGTTITYDYSFDDNGRLTKVKKDGQKVESYAYDKNGNRKQASINGKIVQGFFNQEDQITRYGNNTYKYNADGYLTTKTTPKGKTTYRYGTLGELRRVQLPNNKIISYLHNANNQRVAKKINGEIVEKYLWENLTTLLAIYDKDDKLLQRFEYAGQRMPIAMQYNNEKYYLHYDQVGSLRAISDTNHKIVKEISYDTYGNILNDTNAKFNVPFGFAGGLYDEDTELTRFGYRDYDAYTGKWTAKDPISFAGGDTNLYGYVLSDPVNFVDPIGKIWSVGISAVGALAGAYVGAFGGIGYELGSVFLGHNFSYKNVIASSFGGAVSGMVIGATLSAGITMEPTALLVLTAAGSTLGGFFVSMLQAETIPYNNDNNSHKTECTQ